MPGKFARQRGHPQAEAINVCGWIGILTLGVFWPFALVWAFTSPLAARAAAEGTGDAPSLATAELVRALERVGDRLDKLEARVSDLAEPGEEPNP